ncbi:MAG: hypothetical protein HY053_07645 [Proteobacteria bacterium]|nr:hypothetical protein [Pseudomonadota bacterium]
MLGILCGFETEAKVARLLTPLVECSGAREDVARQKLEALIKKGATALLSFGISGGLSPGTTPRHLIIGDRVMAADGKMWKCDEKLTSLLVRGLPQARKGSVYGSTTLVATPAEKKPLFDRTGCLIVDMESHVVAEAAARHSVRFAVLRGVSDTVDEIFPTAVLASINENGSVNVGVALLGLLKNPAQLPAMIRLSKNTGLALKNLQAAIPLILPMLSQY